MIRKLREIDTHASTTIKSLLERTRSRCHLWFLWKSFTFVTQSGIRSKREEEKNILTLKFEIEVNSTTGTLSLCLRSNRRCRIHGQTFPSSKYTSPNIFQYLRTIPRTSWSRDGRCCRAQGRSRCSLLRLHALLRVVPRISASGYIKRRYRAEVAPSSSSRSFFRRGNSLHSGEGTNSIDVVVRPAFHSFSPHVRSCFRLTWSNI